MKSGTLRPGDPATHFWLTRSSARAVGVNLSEAMAAGWLSAQQYAGMVNDCRTCAHVAQCQAWLASAAVPRRQPYEACSHKALLESLLARLQ